MKIMWQGTVCFLCFLLQFQCGKSALKYGAAKKEPLVADSRLSEQHSEISHKIPTGDAFAGSRRLRYLIALQAWQRATRIGLHCPKPEPCVCHCDCPDTVVTGSTPKPPVACAMLPSFGTPAPPQPTTTAAPPPALPPKPKKCKLGEVAMSDGTCVVLTTKVLETISEIVAQKKEALDELLQKYATLYQPKCVSCPGAAEYFDVRAQLLQAHREYAIVLRFFMNAMRIFEAMEKEKNQGWEHDHDGPEFVPGVKKLRPHCEPWTVNGTQAPDRELCGVICRNQPTCMGFAMDASSGWCLWFDDAEPQSEAVCSSQSETEYVRRWQAKLNATIWATMKKLQIFDKAIITSLKVADVETGKTSAAFAKWTDFEGQNATLKNEKEDHFQKTLDNYTGTLFDLTELRKEYLVLQRTALELTEREAKANPPFPKPPSMKMDKVKLAPIPNGFAAPTQEPPHLVTWDSFPNSEDSEWAKLHPDCPQGVPCVCDCKCRGPPPQNFVEPPPVPTTPCPQFPQAVPNPFMFSVAGGR